MENAAEPPATRCFKKSSPMPMRAWDMAVSVGGDADQLIAQETIPGT